MVDLDRHLAQLRDALEAGAEPAGDVHERAVALRRRRRLAIAAGAAMASVGLIASVAIYTEGGHSRSVGVITQPGVTVPTTPPPAKPTTTVVSPGPTVKPAGSMTWISATHGWALAATDHCSEGACAVVLETTTAGAGWSRANAPAACISSCPAGRPAISSLRFANSQIGYAFGPDLFMTTDGGATWHRQPGRQVDALDVQGSDAIRVSYTSSGCPGPCDWSIERAALGSTSWRPLPIPTANPPLGSSVQLVTEGVANIYVAFLGRTSSGVVGGGLAHVLISHDAGATWSDRSDPCSSTTGKENATVAIAAQSANRFAVLCLVRSAPSGTPASPTFVIVSADAGRSFGPPRSVPEQLPELLALAGASTIVVASGTVTGSGPFTYELVTSHDDGQHWTLAVTDTEPVDGLISGPGYLGFQSATQGHWDAYPNTNWTTTDGGDHWTPHHIP